MPGKRTTQKEQTYALFQVFVTCAPSWNVLTTNTCRVGPFLFRIQTPRVVGLAFLRTVDAVETDALRAMVVQDFERVAVEERKTTGPVKSDASTAEKEKMKNPKVDTERISSLRLKWRATSIIQLTPNNEAENTVQERLLCITRPQTAAPSAEIHNVMHEMPIIF